jgi:UDP-N-acetylmuramoyl-tripeptide--D-alanyl-D-alanine ligase
MIKRRIRSFLTRRLEDRVRALLERQRPIVVAVTGSVGKTSTKVAISQVLETKYRVMVSQSSYNSEIGLPLGFFGLEVPTPLYNLWGWYGLFRKMDRMIKEYPYDIAVVEMGADKPGDIKHFLSFIKPDIGVVTAVGPTHLELFGSVEKVFAEKWQLAEAAKFVIYNADDTRLRAAAAKLPQTRALGYGLNGGGVRADSIARSKDGLSVMISLAGKKTPVVTQVVAQTSILSMLAASAVALHLGLTRSQTISALKSIKPLRGRMNPIAGRKNSLIIDDSYNSSPEAAEAALHTLEEYAPRRRIAILGSMNELGGYSAEGHRRVGKTAAGCCDILITIGSEAKKYLAKAAVDRLKSSQVHSFVSPYDAGDYLSSILEQGDVVLVKGSQNGVFAEEAIKPLMQRPQNAETLLVRQSATWLNRKKKAFGSKS